MKKIIVIGIILIIMNACVKENTPTSVVDNRVDTTVNMQKTTGVFANGPYGQVTGSAKIYQQGSLFTLALENIQISNGPDLHVYISKEIQPVNFIDLGKLQSTMGNQLYVIPGSPDFNQYKYALIHCQQYNHLFGSAELK